MKIRKAIVWVCLIMFCLSIAVSLYSRSHGKSIESRRAREIEHSEGNLEQDQRMFAQDMRQLRHDMLRGASDVIVSADREDVRQDWLAIVMDRRSNRDGPAPAPLDVLEAVRRRVHAHVRAHSSLYSAGES